MDPSRVRPPSGDMNVLVGTTSYGTAATRPSSEHDLEVAMERARTAFRLFDRPFLKGKSKGSQSTLPKGHLTKEELGDAVRWIGLPRKDGLWGPVHPTQQKCEVMEQSLNASGGVTEARFVAAMVPAPPCEAISLEELIAAFQVFDSEQAGFLTDKAFVAILTEWGEAMTVEEAHRSLGHGGIIQGNLVDYRKYASLILQRA